MITPRHYLRILFSFSCFFAALYAPIGSATSYQSHKSIYYAAKTFMTKHVNTLHEKRPEVTIGKLDSRLKLKKCSKKLQVFLPRGSRSMGKTTVGVKCNGKKSWSLHLPLTISLYGTVLVASHQLQKGTTLTAADVKLKKHKISNLSFGYYDDLTSSIGLKLKRRVASGTILTPSMLKKPRKINRGQKVTILARSGSIVIRMVGKSLDNGAIGDRIKVINIKSKRKLEGIVTTNGEVKVDI